MFLSLIFEVIRYSDRTCVLEVYFLVVSQHDLFPEICCFKNALELNLMSATFDARK